MTDTLIRSRLEEAADKDYKKFNDKIVPTSLETLGVRMPALKSLAKELSCGSTEDILCYLSDSRPQSYEEIMLYGLVLGYSKLPLETVFRYFDPLAEKFENWAHVDCIVSALKIFGKNRAEVLAHYLPLKNSSGEFTKRTFVIILMDYFICDEYADEALRLISEVPTGQYYTDMAIAWALSVGFVKYWDKTLAVFDRAKLGEFVYKKTISKCTDSFRISDEKKNYLKSLR